MVVYVRVIMDVTVVVMFFRSLLDLDERNQASAERRQFLWRQHRGQFVGYGVHAIAHRVRRAAPFVR